MLWLIWIVMMVMLPALAGVMVWRDLHHEPREVPVTRIVQQDDGPSSA